MAPNDAMIALRRLKISRMATSARPSLVVVRDSEERVAEAIRLLEELDMPPPE